MATFSRGRRFAAHVGPDRLTTSKRGVDKYVRPYTQDARASSAAVVQQIHEIIRDMKNATPEILLIALLPIFEQSLEWCPIDTGELRNSADIKVDGYGSKARAAITYGNSFAWYAPLVHEMTWLHHDAPTRAKWLQEAMESGVGELPGRLRELYQKVSGIS